MFEHLSKLVLDNIAERLAPSVDYIWEPALYPSNRTYPAPRSEGIPEQLRRFRKPNITNLCLLNRQSHAALQPHIYKDLLITSTNLPHLYHLFSNTEPSRLAKPSLRHIRTMHFYFDLSNLESREASLDHSQALQAFLGLYLTLFESFKESASATGLLHTIAIGQWCSVPPTNMDATQLAYTQGQGCIELFMKYCPTIRRIAFDNTSVIPSLLSFPNIKTLILVNQASMFKSAEHNLNHITRLEFRSWGPIRLTIDEQSFEPFTGVTQLHLSARPRVPLYPILSMFVERLEVLEVVDTDESMYDFLETISKRASKLRHLSAKFKWTSEKAMESNWVWRHLVKRLPATCVRLESISLKGGLMSLNVFDHFVSCPSLKYLCSWVVLSPEERESTDVGRFLDEWAQAGKGWKRIEMDVKEWWKPIRYGIGFGFGEMNDDGAMEVVECEVEEQAVLAEEVALDKRRIAQIRA
ncbi:hypothetical protein HK097_002665 [Rhizophlyctis rosea]|uniref:Uncharacterized protein n=1 Tax=Rhizophlyctis rosea TaxID=64517 RepID=A0AAD5S5P8_9FUNG|nr:hypothetical protein HK097_002665 [Rhizophlyctis rosea]